MLPNVSDTTFALVSLMITTLVLLPLYLIQPRLQKLLKIFPPDRSLRVFSNIWLPILYVAITALLLFGLTNPNINVCTEFHSKFTPAQMSEIYASSFTGSEPSFEFDPKYRDCLYTTGQYIQPSHIPPVNLVLKLVILAIIASPIIVYSVSAVRHKKTK